MTLRSNDSRMSHSDTANPPSQRQLKVGEMIRHALAEIFARGAIADDVLNRHSLTVPEVHCKAANIAPIVYYDIEGNRLAEK